MFNLELKHSVRLDGVCCWCLATCLCPELKDVGRIVSPMTCLCLQGSFLKRGSSSNPMALLAKSGSQMGNTRSFVFGCENSNSGAVAADSQPQVWRNFHLTTANHPSRLLVL